MKRYRSRIRQNATNAYPDGYLVLDRNRHYKSFMSLFWHTLCQLLMVATWANASQLASGPTPTSLKDYMTLVGNEVIIMHCHLFLLADTMTWNQWQLGSDAIIIIHDSPITGNANFEPMVHTLEIMPDGNFYLKCGHGAEDYDKG